ncbi:MAG: cytochrome d ubiquinol oxidase subunit II [Gammaproteobacteria bacterium]
MIELMPDLSQPSGWLPLAFMALMGLSILAYVVLDGFDLGVGVVLPLATDDEKDLMVASIGPFWDANETWLVLGVGILLVAFPFAHGAIMSALYFPVVLMLVGLTLRGVAFDFRVKAHDKHKDAWNRAFFIGSLLASVAQGYMVGMLVMGFERTFATVLFSGFIGICVAGSYALLGAAWLIMKTSDDLQRKAVGWARSALGFLVIGLIAVSAATPLLSQRIHAKWFALENMMVLWPMPVIAAVLFFVVGRSLARLPVRLSKQNEYGIWVPFAGAVGLMMICFHGLAYSLFPYLVVDKMTLWQAAAAPESLMIIFVGAAVVLPMIVAYSVFVYRVFGGKATPLEYY